MAYLTVNRMTNWPSSRDLGWSTACLTCVGTGEVGVKLNGDNAVVFAPTEITLADGVNVAVDDTTGTIIGTAAAQKLGLWGATPVAQPSSTGQTAGFAAGSGTAAKDDSTYTGGTGDKAYTVGDIVKHLKALGILAASA